MLLLLSAQAALAQVEKPSLKPLIAVPSPQSHTSDFKQPEQQTAALFKALLKNRKPKIDLSAIAPPTQATLILPQTLHDDWQLYLAYRDLKVFVIAGQRDAALPAVASASVARDDLDAAIQDALMTCEKALKTRDAYFSTQSQAFKEAVEQNNDQCMLFAVGDLVVINSAPFVQSQLFALIQNGVDYEFIGRGKNGTLLL